MLLVGPTLAVVSIPCGPSNSTVGLCWQTPASFKVLYNVATAPDCCAACAAQTAPPCGLWVFRNPDKTSLNPGCHLKPASAAPTRRSDPLCTSGINTAPTPPPSPSPPPPAPAAPTPSPTLQPTTSCTAPSCLIPSTRRVEPPLYFCTWQAQGRMWMSNGSRSGVNTTAYWYARTHEDWMEGSSYENVFSPPAAATFEAWATAFTPVARAELFFMLDNGWQNGPESTSTELVLHQQRYRQFWTADVNPTQDGTVALRLMRDKLVHEHGWRGLGVWVNGGAKKITVAGFERLHNASIGLLKYDGGDEKCAMSQLAHIYAPNLLVEHGRCVTGCPLNTGSGNGTRSDAASAEAQASTLVLGDSYRTYDTFRVFGTAESLDRNWRVLNASRFANNTRREGGQTSRHFGSSGAPDVSVALGGCIQPMRSNIRGLPIAPVFQTYVTGPRLRQNREDEITRFVNWGKIAPPFGAGYQPTFTDLERDDPGQIFVADTIAIGKDVGLDQWNCSLFDDAAVLGHHLTGTVVYQGAPLIVARGAISLPIVSSARLHKAETSSSSPTSSTLHQPFVIATRFPSPRNETIVLLSALGRTSGDGHAAQPAGFYESKQYDIQIEVADVDSPLGATVGVIGYVNALRICFPAAAIDHGGRRDHLLTQSAADAAATWSVYAQDLTGSADIVEISDDAAKWTDDDAACGGALSLAIDGMKLQEVGLSGRTLPGDQSMPGVVLKFAMK